MLIFCKQADCRCLHSDKFEFLQVLKSAWQKDIADFAALNDEIEDDVHLTLFVSGKWLRRIN